jgi:hypothetical protein
MSTVALAKPSRRHLVWLPALLLVAIGALSASGLTTTDDSIAATATGAVVVSATVAPEVHLDLVNGSCTAAPAGTADNETATFGAVALTTADGPTVLGSCAMSVGTNNNTTTGVTLAMSDARAAGGSDFFLCTSAAGATCALAADDFTDTAVSATLNDGAAGMKLSARTCDDASTNTANFYPIAASSTICVDNTGGAASTLTVQIQANPAPTQPSGSYLGQANFVATGS